MFNEDDDKIFKLVFTLDKSIYSHFIAGTVS